LRRCGVALASAAGVVLLWSLYSLGHGGLALVAALPACLYCRHLVADDLRGAVLICCAERWSLLRCDAVWPLELERYSSGLPWLLYVRFRRPGRRRPLGLWIFRDAMTATDYRRLRVRLAIGGDRVAGQRRALSGVSTVSRASGSRSG